MRVCYTLRADANKFKLMPDDLKIGRGFQVLIEARIHPDRSINDTITSETAEVVVILSCSVEPLQRATQLQFLNLSGFREDFEIPVHGSKTDTGKTLANQRIYLIGAGMGIDFPQLFQDDCALSRHPEVYWP